MSAFISVLLLFFGIFVYPTEYSGLVFITSGLFAVAAEIADKKG